MNKWTFRKNHLHLSLLNRSVGKALLPNSASYQTNGAGAVPHKTPAFFRPWWEPHISHMKPASVLMFRPLSRIHHQGVRNPWELKRHCIDLLECCYVYVFTSRYDSCGMLSILQLSYRDVNTYTQIILTDQYNGFVTLKDFELPDDGFDWGAETCWSDWSVIN